MVEAPVTMITHLEVDMEEALATRITPPVVMVEDQAIMITPPAGMEEAPVTTTTRLEVVMEEALMTMKNHLVEVAMVAALVTMTTRLEAAMVAAPATMTTHLEVDMEEALMAMRSRLAGMVVAPVTTTTRPADTAEAPVIMIIRLEGDMEGAQGTMMRAPVEESWDLCLREARIYFPATREMMRTRAATTKLFHSNMWDISSIVENFRVLSKQSPAIVFN